MSVHSYSRCWVHLVWATLNRERMLTNLWQHSSPIICSNTRRAKAFT